MNQDSENPFDTPNSANQQDTTESRRPGVFSTLALLFACLMAGTFAFVLTCGGVAISVGGLMIWSGFDNQAAVYTLIAICVILAGMVSAVVVRKVIREHKSATSTRHHIS